MRYVTIIVVVFIAISNVIVGKEKCKWGMKCFSFEFESIYAYIVTSHLRDLFL